VQQTAKPVSDGRAPATESASDPALDAAINVARNQVAQR
jgi:hypothetical protein